MRDSRRYKKKLVSSTHVIKEMKKFELNYHQKWPVTLRVREFIKKVYVFDLKNNPLKLKIINSRLYYWQAI